MTRAERGFTIIEVLIALVVMMIGVAGVLAMHATSSRASSYTRHATEAAVLAEDKLEILRTVAIATLENGDEIVDATGNPDDEGLFARSWTVSWTGTVGELVVTVAWNEGGTEPHAITYRTLRNQ
jgi:type IV pilus assembly protein PilV